MYVELDVVSLLSKEGYDRLTQIKDVLRPKDQDDFADLLTELAGIVFNEGVKFSRHTNLRVNKMINCYDVIPNKIIEVQQDGIVIFRLEREDNGQGIWALYKVENGVVGEIIDRDQFRHDILERIKFGFYGPVNW